MVGLPHSELAGVRDEDAFGARLRLLGWLGFVVTALDAVTLAGFSFMYFYSYSEHGFDWMQAGAGVTTVGYLLFGAMSFALAGTATCLASANAIVATRIGRLRRMRALIAIRWVLGVGLP